MAQGARRPQRGVGSHPTLRDLVREDPLERLVVGARAREQQQAQGQGLVAAIQAAAGQCRSQPPASLPTPSTHRCVVTTSTTAGGSVTSTSSTSFRMLRSPK